MWLRFIGTDGSMGLKKDKLYQVSVEPRNNSGILMKRPVLCPYSTNKSFWENWAIPESMKE